MTAMAQDASVPVRTDERTGLDHRPKPVRCLIKELLFDQGAAV